MNRATQLRSFTDIMEGMCPFHGHRLVRGVGDDGEPVGICPDSGAHWRAEVDPDNGDRIYSLNGDEVVIPCHSRSEFAADQYKTSLIPGPLKA